jgi:hemerythrin-like domain-containing protein
MKATDLLQRQHRDIEALLERLHAGGPSDEGRVRQEIAANLVAHTVIEQEIFYPAVREMLPEEILEALEEHGLAEVELARLLAERSGGEAMEAKAAVLSEVVTRHIRREESEILKTAERELDDQHLNELGDEMAARFRQVVETGYQKALHKALAEEMPRTPGRRVGAKKTARRAQAAAKKAKTTRRAAPTARASKRRTAAPKRTGAQRGEARERGQRTPRTPRTQRAQPASAPAKPARKQATRARRSSASAARRRA